MQAYEALGAMGERVLGFAYKNMEGTPMDYAFTNKPEPNFDVKVGALPATSRSILKT